MPATTTPDHRSRTSGTRTIVRVPLFPACIAAHTFLRTVLSREPSVLCRRIPLALAPRILLEDPFLSFLGCDIPFPLAVRGFCRSQWTGPHSCAAGQSKLGSSPSSWRLPPARLAGTSAPRIESRRWTRPGYSALQLSRPATLAPQPSGGGRGYRVGRAGAFEAL